MSAQHQAGVRICDELVQPVQFAGVSPASRKLLRNRARSTVTSSAPGSPAVHTGAWIVVSTVVRPAARMAACSRAAQAGSTPCSGRISSMSRRR
ncbi:hypothetical protein [Phytohabitans rumicis]|uniref:hypothetical protein n=1 Tax=Phytohabitans rumicis TaxID=1076125 RepID=UPI0015632181|nr:hypothetical protein [Phytohabitans rumicis]